MLSRQLSQASARRRTPVCLLCATLRLSQCRSLTSTSRLLARTTKAKAPKPAEVQAAAEVPKPAEPAEAPKIRKYEIAPSREFISPTRIAEIHQAASARKLARAFKAVEVRRVAGVRKSARAPTVAVASKKTKTVQDDSQPPETPEEPAAKSKGNIPQRQGGRIRRPVRVPNEDTGSNGQGRMRVRRLTSVPQIDTTLASNAVEEVEKDKKEGWMVRLGAVEGDKKARKKKKKEEKEDALESGTVEEDKKEKRKKKKEEEVLESTTVEEGKKGGKKKNKSAETEPSDTAEKNEARRERRKLRKQHEANAIKEHNAKMRAERKLRNSTAKKEDEELTESTKKTKVSKSLKDAMLGKQTAKDEGDKIPENLPIHLLHPQDLEFEPIDVAIPPVPMLSYGLDRVLFNPGVYRLQDPRSRVYNFDPYLERIMPVNEFDFDALSEYKTSSKDEQLIALTKRVGTKFTGSTSSMSGILQHFHFLLSAFRGLDHHMLSRQFPEPSKRFSKITYGPSAAFLRHKDGIYAIDADKSYDSPNIMSWLGHSLEKLLTTERSEFERFRRSNPEEAPAEDNSSRCYHYSKQGNVLMRSQLDAYDPRLPGTGVFDLKTRAVVSIRMNHKEYEEGTGYQLRNSLGQWESYEREFYDMTRATLLKYSLQVRMGRMDGIFIAFHNIERIFGFQYLSLADMDAVLHGQHDTRLGDQEFKLSIGLLDDLLSRATAHFPNTSLRLHFDARDAKTKFMYVFAEPVTEEQADEIQSAGEAQQKEFARSVVGLRRDDPKVQAEWQSIQAEVDEQVGKDAPNDIQAEEVTTHLEEAEGATESDELDVDSEEAAKDTNVEDAIPEPEQATITPTGPLMGWTLTLRNKVNDGYVERPQNLEQDDDWKIEYHIQIIAEESRWTLYEAVKERRRQLVGLRDEEADKGLRTYRELIRRYSDRGREWRTKEDEITEKTGIQVYKQMGPGSDAIAPIAKHSKTNRIGEPEQSVIEKVGDSVIQQMEEQVTEKPNAAMSEEEDRTDQTSTNETENVSIEDVNEQSTQETEEESISEDTSEALTGQKEQEAVIEEMNEQGVTPEKKEEVIPSSPS